MRPRPARMLLFSAAAKADAGGVQAVLNGLADHLRARGHEVVTAWPDGDGTAEDWRLSLEAGVGRSGRPGPAALLRAGRGGAGLAARLAAFGPDVVNLHFPMGQSAYFALLARPLGYRLVLSFHGSDLHGASPAFHRALPRLLRAADEVTAVSSDLASAVRALAEDVPVRVLPNGVDTAFWTPGGGAEGRDPLLAVAAGRLTAVKGFDVLLRAFEAGAPPGARLVIAGRGENEGDLRALASELDLADRVRFAGRLDRAALRATYRRAGLFVLSSRREGMPLALMEAMATGLPAVATAVSGARDVMTEACGEVVAPEDEAALARALPRWLGAPDRLAAAGRAARARAEAFGDAASYERYERCLLDERDPA